MFPCPPLSPTGPTKSAGRWMVAGGPAAAGTLRGRFDIIGRKQKNPAPHLGWRCTIGVFFRRKPHRIRRAETTKPFALGCCDPTMMQPPACVDKMQEPTFASSPEAQAVTDRLLALRLDAHEQEQARAVPKEHSRFYSVADADPATLPRLMEAFLQSKYVRSCLLAFA